MKDISNALITINKLKPQFYIRTAGQQIFVVMNIPVINFTANDLSNGLPKTHIMPAVILHKIFQT